MEAFKRASPVVTEMIPWNCTAKRVCALWASITHSQNEGALEEWLLMVAPGQDEAWAHQPFLECLCQSAAPGKAVPFSSTFWRVNLVRAAARFFSGNLHSRTPWRPLPEPFSILDAVFRFAKPCPFILRFRRLDGKGFWGNMTQDLWANGKKAAHPNRGKLPFPLPKERACSDWIPSRSSASFNGAGFLQCARPPARWCFPKANWPG